MQESRQRSRNPLLATPPSAVLRWPSRSRCSATRSPRAASPTGPLITGAEEGDHMKFISRRLATALAALTLALAALAGSAAGAASAATTPVVYAAHLDPWHGYVRPGQLYFGNGGAPYFTALQWKSWGSGSAWGTGRLWNQNPGCHPSDKCACHSRW